MGRLLNKWRVPVQRAPVQRAQGQRVDIEIVGESHYVSALARIRRQYGDGEFEIVLRPDPSNHHDGHAVAVYVGGAIVGYLARDMAADWQPMILAAEAEGFVVAGSARLLGGTRDKPNLGVFGWAPWAGPGRPVDRWGR